MSTLPQVAIQPQQQPSPIQQAGQALSLKDLMQQSQMQNINLQNAQQDQQDQLKFRQAFTEANGDPDKTVKLAAASGVGPKLLVPYQQSVQDRKTKLLTYNKDALDLQSKQADIIQGAHDKVTAADPADRPAVYAQQTQALKEMGLDTSQFPPQYPGDDAFKTIGAAVQGHAQMIKDAQAASETDKNTSQARDAKANAVLAENKANIAANYQKDPSQLLAQVDAAAPSDKYPGLNMRTKSLVSAALKNGDVENATKAINEASQQVGGIEKETNPAVQANKIATAKAEGQARADIAARYNPLIPGSAAGGGNGQPAEPPTIDTVPATIKGRVQAILDYRDKLPPAGRSNPVNNAISYYVNALDPQHDETNFPARNNLMKSMTSGPLSKQLGATNTALGHIGVLSDAIDALNNGNVQVLNSIANKLGAAVGTTPATTLKTIVHRVGPELSAAYIEGGGGEGERGTTAADFDSSLGNDQLKANAAITAKLLRSKIASTEQNYKQTMQRDDFQDRFITPEAKATLAKLSPQGGGAGDGQTVGHKVGDVIVQNGRSFKATKVDDNGKVVAADPQ